MVGDRDRPQSGSKAPDVGEVGEVALDLALVGEVGVDLWSRGPTGSAARPRTSARPAPAKTCQRRRQGWPGSSSRQPSRPSATKIASIAAGEHRVAGDDRQAGAGEEGEGAEREDGGGDAERGAAAQEGEAEHDRRRAAPTIPGHCSTSPSRRGP